MPMNMILIVIFCHISSYNGNNDNMVLHLDNVYLQPIQPDVHLGHIIRPGMVESVILDASYSSTRDVNFILANLRHSSYSVKLNCSTHNVHRLRAKL
jgi:hypothetical protein